MQVNQVEREIIDIIPYELQTEGNIEWVRDELAVSTPAVTLNKIKQYFEVSNSEILHCQNRLEQMGIDLYSHIKETRQRFSEVDDRISKLETRLEISERVADIRYDSQKEINRLTNDRINSTDSNIVRSNRYYWGGDPTLIFFGIVFCLFVFPLCIATLGSVVNSIGAKSQAPIHRGY